MIKNTGYTIKDLPEDERPREKLYKYGVKALSNSELLAIIIRTGNREKTAIEISQELLALDKRGIAYLTELSFEELTSINGIGKCKASQIISTLELVKRISAATGESKIKITSPKDVINILMEEMRYLKKEFFKIILLDTKNQIIVIKDISIGSLSSSIVHPREVFNVAIKRSAASIILVHNHPSGDPYPSKEDINVTNRLIECGDIIGIKILDHIIIGDGKYSSLKEKNII
ncbi:RadC family protein [Sporosalibacterium faouarense]|uniref:RadC family protein n=1 Tax=Sporosalibacterium faouarense TaxID=516123 RepID=UPI00141D29CB|nr:DNA repair protein RadC [Sporosalibacterium faouarense]MTI48515.1 JAB domain-containing protein [Bacillota bacterium]